MTHNVVTVDMDASLTRVRGLLDKAWFHHLLVVDEGKLVGVISDRDVLREVSPFLDTPAERPRDLATLNRKAHQIMTRHPQTIHPDAPIADAIGMFLKSEFSCLPVVEDKNIAAGILTWRDILRALHVNER